MKLKDIIDVVAEDGNNPLNKSAAKIVLDLVLSQIVGALTKGEHVELPGIGKLEVKDRAAKTGRNPATGETIQIPAKKAVGLKVSKTLKDLL